MILRSGRQAVPPIADRFMRARVMMLWIRIRDSLWFIPAILTVLGAALALALVQLERQGMLGWTDKVELGLFSGGAEGARAVLGAIVGGLMTVTGVAFSVTIVALQLASSQFTPRVLRNFAADRVNQMVLGVLIGTFTYAMLVLRAVRSDEAKLEPFVPHASVTVGVLLALVSIGWLIYFINHAAASMRVSVILERVSQETLRHVRTYFCEPFADGDPVPDPEPGGDAYPVTAHRAGYLQAVDSAVLAELGRRCGSVIRMTCDMGQFVLKGQPLASVESDVELDEQTLRTICQAFVLGDERTPKQDVAFGIMEIADIAIKALSPSVNDPTTATHCIDRLIEILQELGGRNPPRDKRSDSGRAHFIARHLQYDRAVGIAFDQIRHFGADNPAIATKLIESLALLVTLVPPQRCPPLVAQAQAVLEDARATLKPCAAQRDLERLEATFRALCASVARGGAAPADR